MFSFFAEPGAGVLIRAIQPTAGLDRLRIFRKGGATMTATQLCNGPGRLCQAFDITTSVFNKHDLHSGQSLWLEHDPDPQTMTVVAAKRIGINPRSCGEQSVQQLWRYYLLGCPDVSKRDRISEAKLGLQSGTIAAGGSSFDKDRKNIRKPRKVKESCSLGQL
jgi:3-methyladenine DNA glycosylase Mpg